MHIRGNLTIDGTYPGGSGGSSLQHVHDTADGAKITGILEVDDVKPSWGGSYNGIELENMETFMDGKFFHFRGGTLWDGKTDVYERKLSILNTILETV